MMDYQIFADVTAELTDELVSGLPRVEIIPMEVEIGGRNYTYGPGGDLTAEEFYTLQRAGNFANTTQIAPGAFLPHFEPVLEAGRDLIYFPLTAGLSGTFQSAMMCISDLRKKYPQRRILCVDSHCASAGQGFLVREAARQQAAGLTVDELAQWVEENSWKIGHWFTVDTFDHLKHGGRVSAAVAVMGTALQIKPLLCVDREGTLQVKDKPRGHKRAMAVQLSHMAQEWAPQLGTLVIIGHGDDPEAAADLREQVLQAHPDAQVFLVPIGPVIGAHTGPGMLALTYWGSSR